MTVEMALTQGKKTIVDKEDAVMLAIHNWTAVCGKSANSERWYGRAMIKINGRWRGLWLARFLMGEPKGLCVDHINGDTLDNRRSNLRIVTRQQNNLNRHVAWGSSKFRGVSRNKGRKKWEAVISLDKKQKHLGYFKTEEEAAKVYDKEAKKLFGEFACLNFTTPTPNGG